MKRDKQKSAVYRWQIRVVAPHDKTPVPFDQIEGIVKYVWTAEGLEYPPLVEPLPKQVRRWCGDATRTRIRFSSTIYTWVILHEISHALTFLHTYENNGHGALFMGIYCQLLSRYLHLDFQQLIQSAEKMGLHVTPDARPVFLD